MAAGNEEAEKEETALLPVVYHRLLASREIVSCIGGNVNVEFLMSAGGKEPVEHVLRDVVTTSHSNNGPGSISF